MKCPPKFGPDGKIEKQITYQRRGPFILSRQKDGLINFLLQLTKFLKNLILQKKRSLRRSLIRHIRRLGSLRWNWIF